MASLKELVVNEAQEVEDETNNVGDERLNHSWPPSGYGLGWFWIPRGVIFLDVCYPARPYQIRRFGHLTKRVRVTPPPKSLNHQSPKLEL